MSTETTNPPRIEVLSPGVKAQFEHWIATRGGVIVWKNINFSDPGAGNIFTPATTQDGKPGRDAKPRWSHEYSETVTDIKRFKFTAALKEVKRFRVGVRMGSQGMSLKVTDGGTRRIRKECAKAKEKYNAEAKYRFDYETQEAVIEIVVPEKDE